jgi:hypothetical protein
VNGINYNYPETNDEDWGIGSTNWAQAVTSGMLQKNGGLFSLLAELDLGASYGIKSISYKTRSSNIADAGQFRLARADKVSWRNQANGANLDLEVNSSNHLVFNSLDFNLEFGNKLNTADFTDAAVTSKLITGYSIGSGTVAESDTILQAINKICGNINLKLTAASFNDLTVTAKLITGFVSGAGAVLATDSILQAIDKLDGNIGLKLASADFSSANVMAKLLTGYSSAAGTVASGDTLVVGINKLNGNTEAIKHTVINEQTDSYTLVLTDDGKWIDMNKSTSNNLTVPKSDTVNFPIGTAILVRQMGAGITTIVATSGVTINNNGLVFTNRHGVASLFKVATNTWVAFGSLEV